MTEKRTLKPLSPKDLILKFLLYFVVFDICMLILYPYFVMFCTALKSRAEIFAMNGTILPIEAMWSNFTKIWTLAPMGQYMLNSVLVAGGSTLIWFGLTWSLELYQQTNARLWRQGQQADRKSVV